METKKNALLMLDGETCNIIKSDKVKPGNNLLYDIGYSVLIPSTGEVLCESSNVIPEIFFGEEEKMRSAYYAEKLPRYYADIKAGRRTVRSFFDVMNDIKDICDKYNIVAMVAHNARFDVDALNTTARYLTGLDWIFALPPTIEVWDSMKMAKTFADTPTYRKFCETNGFMTKHKTPRPQMKAETLYRFLTNDLTFTESHTGLEDVRIEREIVKAAYKTHKKMDRVLYERRMDK